MSKVSVPVSKVSLGQNPQLSLSLHVEVKDTPAQGAYSLSLLHTASPSSYPTPTGSLP